MKPLLQQPPNIPDHALLRRIGSGSYGEVWLARNVFKHYRAIKIITAATQDQERQLEREFEGIKKFEPISRSHEGFVDILHAGHDQERRLFYYVMELGDDQTTGQEVSPDSYTPKTLSSEIGANGRLPVRDCVRYGLLLCDALRALHDHKLLHRDVKPGNIIFVNGTPKLADIGLVTQIDQANSYVGTEGFIPPEGPTSVQADVYALGKVLYEMGTGRDRKEFPALPADLNQFSDPAEFLELNEVIVRACHTDREKRYPTARALLEELGVLQQGDSIKRLRWLERRWKTVKRTGLVCAFAVAAAAVIGFPVVQHRQMEAQQRSRQAGRLTADVAGLVGAGDSSSALPLLAQVLELDKRNPKRTRTHWLRAHYLIDQLPALCGLQIRPKPVCSLDWSPDGRRIVIADYLGKATIWDLETDQLSKPFGPSGGLQMVRFSPDGRWVATADHNRTARIYDAHTLELRHRLAHSAGLFSATWSHNGLWLVTGDFAGNVTVWDAMTGATNFIIKAHTSHVTYAAFSPDDRLIVSTGFDKSARLWRVEDQKLHRDLSEHGEWVWAAAFSPDGETLLTVSFDRFARVWDLATGQLIRPVLKHSGGIRDCVFSGDGAWLITASYDSTVRVWQAATHEPETPAAVLHAGGQVFDVALAPDGERLAYSSEDGTVRVYSLAAARTRRRPTARVYAGTSHRYITATNTQVQVVDHATGVMAEFTPPAPPLDMAISHDASVIATLSHATSPPTIAAWNVAHPAAPIFSTTTAARRVVLSGNGATLAGVSSNLVTIYDLARSNLVVNLSFDRADNTTAVFHPDGTRVAVVNRKMVQLRSASTGELQFPEIEHPGDVTHVSFSPNGRLFVTTCADVWFARLPARIFEVASGRQVGPSFTHRDGILAACFSPDGRHLVTCGEDFTAITWDATTGRLLFLLEHSDQVLGASYSEDGQWLATCTAGGMVRIWDATTGEPITPVLYHPRPMRTVRFVRGGQELWGVDIEGQGWLHQVKTDAMPLPALKLCGDLISGNLLLVADGSTDQQAADLAAAWGSFRGRFAFLTPPSVPELISWHRERVQLLRERKNLEGANFHEGRVRTLLALSEPPSTAVDDAFVSTPEASSD